MTKKDYIKIAEVLKDARQCKARIPSIINKFANMLEVDNPNFDRERFIKFIN